MSSSEKQDKRWCERREIEVDVKVVFHNRTYYARTRNMSLGGLFVDLNYVLIPRDAEVEVVLLPHKEQGGEMVSFKTRVAYVTPQGYGMEFKNFNTADVRKVQDILCAAPNEVVRIA